MQSERAVAFITQQQADARNFADDEFVRAYEAAERDVDLLSIDAFRAAEREGWAPGADFYSDLMEAGRVRVTRLAQGHGCRVQFEPASGPGRAAGLAAWFLGPRAAHTVAPVKFYTFCLAAEAAAPVRVHKEAQNIWTLSSAPEEWPMLEGWLEDKLTP